jgi:hypothetical protein
VKKFVFIAMIIATMLTSCSLFDKYTLDPPQWIIGRWTQGESRGFVFSDYDIAYIDGDRVVSFRNQAERGDKLTDSSDSESYSIRNLYSGDYYSITKDDERIHVNINGYAVGYFDRL